MVNLSINRPMPVSFSPVKFFVAQSPRFGGLDPEGPKQTPEEESAQLWRMGKNILFRVGFLTTVFAGAMGLAHYLKKPDPQPAPAVTAIQEPVAAKTTEVKGTVTFHFMHMNLPQHGEVPRQSVINSIAGILLKTPEGKTYLLEGLSKEAMGQLLDAQSKENITVTGELGQEEKTIKGFHWEVKGQPLKVKTFLLDLVDRQE